MKKTIEMKKVASVNEAIEIINRLNYRNDTFEYHGYTREDNADIKYRHFDGYKENGEPDGFSLIEIVVGGKLEVVRFFNHFRNITVDIKLGDFNLDYSRYDEVIDADAKIESNAEVESNDAEAKAEHKMKITTKIATNGVKLYYVDGKRTSREVALQAAADNRENLFTIEYATRHNAYFTNGENQVYESTSKAVLKELELKIDEYHGFTVQLHTIGWVEICKLFNKDYAKSLINKIENAFIRGEYGVKIDKYGKVSILPAPVIEPNPDDYAVTEDAFQIAVNAEIQNANNVKINDLKWEIRYTEGSINDLDKNHIAHAPNDQSLKERRTELVNELDNLKAQLAEIEPDNTPQVDPIIQERNDARNEYDQLNQVRKAIEKDCERYERLRDRCKSGSPKRREYYQLLESFKPIIRAFGEKFIAAQDRYNKSLTLRTDEERAATQKAVDEYNADLDARGIKYFATVYYYPNGVEGEDMSTFEKDCTSLDEANAFVSQEDHDGVYVGGIYDAGWEITDRNHNLIADHTTGLKEENTMNNRDKFLKVAKVIKCEENINNAKCWYYNTLADIDTEHWKRISKARANEILFCYGLTAESFLAEQKLIDEETRKRNLEKFAPKEIVHPRTIKAQADFYADKIKRDAQPSNDNIFDLLPTLDELNDFSETDPYLMDDDAEYTDRDARFNYGERYAAALTEKLSQYDPTVEVTYDIDDDDEDVYYLKFDGIYRSPYTLSGIESAFHRLKKDIAEEEFMKNVDDTLDDKIAALKRKRVRDSINRAIKQCIRNRIGYLKSHNSKMEKYEYELLCLLQGARRELEVA